MADKNTVNRCLKRLRALTGLTQKEFARVVGLSHPTITSLEVGRLQVTPRIARRIALTVGAMGKSLLDTEGTPKDRLGKEYTREFYEKWSTRMTPEDRKMFAHIAESDIKKAAATITLLLKTALEEDKLTIVNDEYLYWIASLLEDLELTSPYAEMASESAEEPVYTLEDIHPFWVLDGRK